jgi:hypothetical protein
MAREMNPYFAPRLAKVGQFGLSPDGITFAGIVPAIVLEMPKFENAALGLADVTSAFQLISRKALWEVLCALEDSRTKVKLQRKFLALYSGTLELRTDTTFWKTERRWLLASERE